MSSRGAPQPGPRRDGVVALAIGFSAQVAQLVMFREMLAVCRGAELFFGVVLAAGLVWTALGSLLASLIGQWGARRSPRWPDLAGRLAVGLCALNGLVLLGQVVLVRWPAPGGGLGLERTFLEATGLAVAATGPVCLLAGLEFVFLLQSTPVRRFARLYKVEALGATAGGLVLSFALVAMCSSVVIGPLVAVAVGLALTAASRSGRRWLGAVAAVCAAVLAGVIAADLDGRLHARRWAARYPGYKLLATEDSRYGQLAVLRHPEVNQVSLYLDGGLVQTLPAPGTAPTDARNEALLAVAQHPAPKRVLVVGGSLGRLPTELARMKLDRVDVVEIDPTLVRLARRFGGARFDDPRIHVHLADGRYFLKRTTERYDIILLKVPTPLSALVNRYYTQEFYREACARLTDRGVLVTSVMAAANYPGHAVGRLSGSILRTLRAVFAHVAAAPGERHTFFASRANGGVTLDPALLGQRVAGRGLVLPDVDPDFRKELAGYYKARFENLIVTSQAAALRKTLEEVGADVNRDARPIVYAYALTVWNQITSARMHEREPGIDSGTNAVFEVLAGLTFEQALVGPVALGVLVLAAGLIGRLGRRAGGRSAAGAFACLLVALATGLFGMAGEVVLLLAFQNAYGYAYAEVGVIVAAFMASLAAGAAVGRRLRRAPVALALLVWAMFGVCAALVPLVKVLTESLSLSMLYVAFLALVGLVGFLDGATFPPLVRSLGAVGVRRPGGWVYAADLLGAGIGALAVGAVLVPVLGMNEAMILVGLVLLAALLALPSLGAGREQFG